MEWPHEIFYPARVALNQFARVVAVMGDIAPATSRDANFGQYLRPFFEDEDLFRAALSCGDGSIKAGGTATDHNQFKNSVCHSGKETTAPVSLCQPRALK